VPPEDQLAATHGVHLVGYSFLSLSGAQAAAQLIDAARRAGRWVALDVGIAPSRQIPQKILQLLVQVDILFVGREEAAALTGEPDSAAAFRALESAGAREVLMKQGDQGCLFRENGGLRHVPAFSVQAMDTTGAGDAFAAAFLRARLFGWPAADAALLANAAGAAASLVMGAGESMPAPRAIAGVLGAGRLAPPWDGVRVRVLEQLRNELSLQNS